MLAACAKQLAAYAGPQPLLCLSCVIVVFGRSVAVSWCVECQLAW